MTPKFDCVKSFMDTDVFRKFSTKYGLDCEIVASLCETFGTYVDLPKEKWFKYHPPIEVKVAAPIKVERLSLIMILLFLLLMLRNPLSLLE